MILPIVAGLIAASVVLAEEEAADSQAPEEESITYGAGRETATLANKQIIESSGLACSRRVGDILWTHNDSGDSPRIFAFNMEGEDLATYKIAGAAAFDWEDMASFKIGRKPYLLLADIGDNARRRENAHSMSCPSPR